MVKGDRRIIKSMGIYTFSNVINAAIPFLLLPLLTKYLSTSDYGVLSNFNALTNIMIPLVGINLMSSVQVQYLKEEVNFQDYVTSGFRFNIVLALVFSIIVGLFASQLSSLTGVPESLLYTLSVYAIFNTVIEVLLAIWRMEDKATLYGVFRISRTVVEIGLVIFYVIGCEMNFEGSIYAMLISYGVATVGAIIILSRKGLLFGVFRFDYLKHALSYGVPLIPHTLSATAIMYADKLILTHYHGLSSNGVYSVGFLVGQVIGLLQNSFNQAWVPWVFQKLKAGKESDKLRMVKITYFYFAGILFTVFVLWLMLPFIYAFLGKAFQGGMELVLWIALGFAFNGMYKMVGVYMFYLERTGIIALTSIGVAALNIILSLILIPQHGEYGAAYSSMISMISLFFVTWFISSRMLKMPWNLKKHG